MTQTISGKKKYLTWSPFKCLAHLPTRRRALCTPYCNQPPEDLPGILTLLRRYYVIQLYFTFWTWPNCNFTALKWKRVSSEMLSVCFLCVSSPQDVESSVSSVRQLSAVSGPLRKTFAGQTRPSIQISSDRTASSKEDTVKTVSVRIMPW